MIFLTMCWLLLHEIVHLTGLKETWKWVKTVKNCKRFLICFLLVSRKAQIRTLSQQFGWKFFVKIQVLPSSPLIKYRQYNIWPKLPVKHSSPWLSFENKCLLPNNLAHDTDRLLSSCCSRGAFTYGSVHCLLGYLKVRQFSPNYA